MKPILVLGMIIPLLLSACFPYPVLKKLQPNFIVSVRDEKGAPVAGANVILSVIKQPHSRFEVLEVKQTDNEGFAGFQSRREWRFESLMIHGAEVFHWSFCVEKPGYAIHQRTEGKNFQSEATFILKSGLSQTCSRSGDLPLRPETELLN